MFRERCKYIYLLLQMKRNDMWQTMVHIYKIVHRTVAKQLIKTVEYVLFIS